MARLACVRHAARIHLLPSQSVVVARRAVRAKTRRRLDAMEHGLALVLYVPTRVGIVDLHLPTDIAVTVL